jgi:chloramphenicol O-acetyltransferase
MDREKELMDILEKRMKTIMIGSLARFEENFDYLWEEDSKFQDKFYDLWQKTREEVLDYGNNQIRVAKKDMEKVVDNISKPKIQYKYRVDFRRNNNEY